MLNRTPPRATRSLPGFAELARNTTDRPDCELAVRGKLPRELDGVLYRNGPGLFSRAGRTNGTLLDGDGIIQRLELHPGRARYGRRFVRTPKFLNEASAGHFTSPTWTTRAPGIVANIGGRTLSQAGITTYLIQGTLYALDEVAPGFEIDPQTLATRGEATLGLPDHDAFLKAHAKYLAATGDWVFASARMGRHGMSIDLVLHAADGRRIRTPTVHAPRMCYLHDFGVAGHYAIVILQPAFVRVLRYLSGWSTFSDSLAWRPAEGNVVLAIDLATGDTTRFEAPASWIWHVANASERGHELTVDFVGYADPGHFLGHDAQLAAMMRHEEGERGAPGHLRRYVLDMRRRKLTESMVSNGNHEFPTIDPRTCGLPQRRVYATQGTTRGILHTGIAAIDTGTGLAATFDFGPHVNALEPVFAARPGGRVDDGWLIAQILDTRRDMSGFAIFDASHVGDGPVACVELDETLPISFHGHWVGC